MSTMVNSRSVRLAGSLITAALAVAGTAEAQSQTSQASAVDDDVALEEIVVKIGRAHV